MERKRTEKWQNNGAILWQKNGKKLMAKKSRN